MSDNVWRGKRMDLVGQRFGALVVIEYAGFERKRTKWLCRCDCGEVIVAKAMRLREGRKKSCGVNGHRWIEPKNIPDVETFPEYASWEKMKLRCYNPRHHKYENYGARGIVVCEAWRESFWQFLSDMGPKPTAEHTIDRYPDNDGNYEPSNCRWATRGQQARNTRRSVYVEYEGEKMLLAELTDKLGLDRNTVYGRLKNGWCLEDAITVPVKEYKKQDDDWGPEVNFT